MKHITIPIDDLVQSFINAGDGMPVEARENLWLENLMMEYRNALDLRFQRLFTGLLFPLIANARLPMDRGMAVDEAEKDLRRQFNTHNYLLSFLNFPKLIKVANPHAGKSFPGQDGKLVLQPDHIWVPEKTMSIKNLRINVDRFNLFLENNTITSCEGLLEDMIKDASRKPEEKMFKELDPWGTWYFCYIRMLKKAEEVDPRDAMKTK